MALQSRLFRGDAKLEAAAVSDPAHIVLGAAGEHVRKIQVALIQLDGAAIDADGKYGPATANAVLAYKRKRNIINPAYQTQADNIVGKMTMAALDQEMLAKEAIRTEPIQIKPVYPPHTPGVPIVRLGFKIDVDFPVFPNGNPQKIRLASRTTGVLEVVNGADGKLRCTNVGRSEGKISLIFDPNQPAVLPESRLIPGPRGPNSDEPHQDGGTVRITKDSFTVHVDAFHPDNAFIDAATATSANTLALEVRAPKLISPPGFVPPTKTRPGSRFISANDSEPGPPGFRKDFGARPVNPKGTGRKINIFGSQETPGFEDYTTVLQFSGFVPGKFRLVSDASTLFRPWTQDANPAVGVQDGTASDICIRDSPIFKETLEIIGRMASSGCRLTAAFSREGAAQFVPILKKLFPGANILEEFEDAIVMELP
jgi:peptidoglycan hydrolase-like protein with peptidoglycan-binding domain